MLAYLFLGLAVVFMTAYFVTRKKAAAASTAHSAKDIAKPHKINYGPIRIFYGSQTGTAAKLSEQLAEEATEEGFQPQVVDLKDVHISHFDGINSLSLFLVSNTGEGDPPENCIRWMKILKKKESIDEVRDISWNRINFAVFGLGNTQYENYNVTGIAIDQLLHENGAKRVFQLGLGDDNCSLEDDFIEWRKNLWPTLKEFRTTHPLTEEQLQQHHNIRKISSEYHSDLRNLSKIDPVYANYRICFHKENQKPDPVNEQDLDFKTKISLKAQKSKVSGIKQIRQNQNDGSTLELEIELEGHPEYQTAGNIALYGRNDPLIVKQVIEYFEIREADLDRKIGLNIINEDKKVKLNFVPNTLRTLLEQSIDLQGKITKSILKKLSKLSSSNSEYFVLNSSLKTTEEYRRITQKSEPEHWYNLIKIIKEYQVKMAFQDFVELSDSMAPRLFTIASHYHTQRNVVVAASLTENGLISKYFLTKPQQMMAELRKSTFTDAMKWKKVIFVAAGTGLAPFRAYLQQKVYLNQQRQEGKQINVPAITLIFGCKHEHGDFIYKDEILGWRDQGVIDKLLLAFSRDSQKKVYVQNILQQQEEELKELGDSTETAIYICGSLPMGNEIVEVMSRAFGAQRVKQMEAEGRIVKELW